MFINKSERKEGGQPAEGEADSTKQGVWCGTQSQDLGIMTQAKGRPVGPTEATQAPYVDSFQNSFSYVLTLYPSGLMAFPLNVSWS